MVVYENDRGCAKWGRRIGRQSLKEGLVRAGLCFVGTSITCMVGTIMSLFGWCMEVYVSLYEDACVVLVNVCICWVDTNELMFSLEDMSVFSVVSSCIV